MALTKTAKEQGVKPYSEHRMADGQKPESDYADAESYMKHFRLLECLL